MMDKPVLTVRFSDFWPGFDPHQNYFVDMLGIMYDVRLVDQPQLLIYSVFGQEFRQFDCRKVFYTGENVRPNLDECDLALSFDYLDHPKHVRFPLWAMCEPTRLIKPSLEPNELMEAKPYFCNFIYSNGNATIRRDFFRELSKYKHIDSGGQVDNNLGYCVQDKMTFIRDYKFTIAFENSEWPGYCTEKVVHPMLVNSIPIYWGDPYVGRDFNTKSIVNYYDYGNIQAVIERVVQLDQDDSLYRQLLQEPWYPHNLAPWRYSTTAVLARISERVLKYVFPGQAT